MEDTAQTEVLVSPEDLASHYDQPGYASAWDAVEDYQRVLEYTADSPNKGSAAIANALELPRGRIQSWTSGSRPTVVRAIQIAEENDWIPLTDTDKQLQIWTGLIAWICSKGSIAQSNYTPMFGVSDDSDIDRISNFLERLGLEYDIYHQESSGRAQEVRVAEHRSIVGRVLVQLGAPRGPRKKTYQIPQYIQDGSDELQRLFASVYLDNAADYWEWRDGYIIKQPEYPDTYRHSLADLFREVSPSDDDLTTVDVNEDSIFVSVAIVDDIQEQVPELGTE